MTPHVGLLLFTGTLCLVALSTVLLKQRTLSRPHLRSKAAYGRIALQASSAAEDATVSLWMRVAVSLIILASALFLILSRHYDSDQQKWAFGVVGIVLGYWFKG